MILSRTVCLPWQGGHGRGWRCQAVRAWGVCSGSLPAEEPRLPFPGCTPRPSSLAASPTMSQLYPPFPGCTPHVTAAPPMSQLHPPFPGCTPHVPAAPPFLGCTPHVPAVPPIPRLHSHVLTATLMSQLHPPPCPCGTPMSWLHPQCPSCTPYHVLAVGLPPAHTEENLSRRWSVIKAPCSESE